MNIFHISDLHYNPDDQLGQANIKKVFEHILTQAIKPDLLIITGDIINANTLNYEPIFTEIKNLNIPFLCISGNHDISENLIESLKKYCPAHPLSTHKGKLDYICDDFPLKFIALDSYERNMAGGNILDTQLQWMEDEIIHSDKPVVILVHQFPLWADLDFFDKKTGSSWRNKFCDIVAKHSAKIKLIASGHMHNSLMGTIEKTPVVSCFSANWQAHLDFTPFDNMKEDNRAVGYFIHRYINGKFISYAVCL